MKISSTISLTLVILLVTGVVACNALSVPAANYPRDTLQTVFENTLDDKSPVGIVGAVRYPDGRIDVAAAGMSTETDALTTDMALGLGSATKTFTAALIFRLVDQGVLSLDDTLADLVPDVVGPNIPGNITVRHLLEHSSGLYDPITDSVIEEVLANPDKRYSIESQIDRMQAPIAEVGSIHSYSNMNYMLLGHIIETATGQSYDAVLRNEILDPLELDSIFLGGFEELRGEVGHSWVNGESLATMSQNGIGTMAWASGALFATPADATAWFATLFGGDVLSTASLAEMLTFFSGEDDDFGRGIFRTQRDGRTLYFHTGQTISYNSTLVYDAETGVTVAVIANHMDSPDTTPIAFQLVSNAASSLSK